MPAALPCFGWLCSAPRPRGSCPNRCAAEGWGEVPSHPLRTAHPSRSRGGPTSSWSAQVRQRQLPGAGRPSPRPAWPRPRFRRSQQRLWVPLGRRAAAVAHGSAPGAPPPGRLPRPAARRSAPQSCLQEAPGCEGLGPAEAASPSGSEIRPSPSRAPPAAGAVRCGAVPCRAEGSAARSCRPPLTAPRCQGPRVSWRRRSKSPRPERSAAPRGRDPHRSGAAAGGVLRGPAGAMAGPSPCELRR